MNQIKRI